MIEPDAATLDLRAETVAAIQSLGLPFVLWTINDAARMTQAAGWGVDGIITDRHDLAYPTLG